VYITNQLKTITNHKTVNSCYIMQQDNCSVSQTKIFTSGDKKNHRFIVR